MNTVVGTLTAGTETEAAAGAGAGAEGGAFKSKPKSCTVGVGDVMLIPNVLPQDVEQLEGEVVVGENILTSAPTTTAEDDDDASAATEDDDAVGATAQLVASNDVPWAVLLAKLTPDS